MYVAVDIGGSKTLIAIFNTDGEIVRTQKFATPQDYPTFLEELGRAYSSLQVKDAVGAGVAVPGRLDRKKGTVIACGNLPWRNQPIERDIRGILDIPITIENDAKLAAISEAKLVINEYKRVIYLTVSTGIGLGVVINGKLDPALHDAEAGSMLAKHDNKLEHWESFASGQALHKEYHKLASEIPAGAPEWEAIAKNLAPSIFNLVALVQPDVVIIGGGVGEHLPKFQALLNKELKSLEMDMVQIPPVIQAQRPSEAVIYGCYDVIRKEWREHYG